MLYLPELTRHNQSCCFCCLFCFFLHLGKSIRRDSISSLPPKPVDSVRTTTNRNQTSLARYPFSLSNGMRPSSPRLGDSPRRYGGKSHYSYPSYPNLFLSFTHFLFCFFMIIFFIIIIIQWRTCLLPLAQVFLSYFSAK